MLAFQSAGSVTFDYGYNILSTVVLRGETIVAARAGHGAQLARAERQSARPGRSY